jgi:Carboxypeptidase regulatory-like domain
VFDAQQKLFSVEAILGENGTITFAYTGDFSIPVNQGSSATVGIENAAGTTALRYLYNTAALHSGDGLVITPPGTTTPTTGSITGTVTGNGTPVAGATVVSSTGARTTSAANGTYTLAGLAPGATTVTATTTADKCAGRTGSGSGTVTGGQSTTVNIALDSGGSRDALGYTCQAAPRAFSPADTTLALTGDDAYLQVTTPFPIKLYGQSASSVYIDTDGFVSFAVPTANDWISGPIPSSSKPNAALYPFWDDLMVDGSASVLTKTTGTAPNRQYIIEWRNVFVFDHADHRFSFEAIISENGDIAYAYTGDMTAAPGQGGEATVGIENAAGTIALQYSCNTPVLRSGDGITFHLN